MARIGFYIEEEERQMVIMALANLAVIYPGWLDSLERTVIKFHGQKMFNGFLELSTGKVNLSNG